MEGKYFVYIIYNKDNDKFYIGQTNDLDRRIFEHNNKKTNYTSKYSGEWALVRKEIFNDRTAAMKRENFLKRQKNKEFYKNICGII
jgi:putative endonuclease